MRYLIILLLCSGCTAKWHQNRSERHRLIAISKGAVIIPDTVHITKTIKIEVAAVDDSTKVKPEIDGVSFERAIFYNDSLVLTIADMKTQLATGVAFDKEKVMYKLVYAQEQIRTLRKRLQNGYTKDSTYVYEPDSLTKVKVTIKNGLLDKIDYSRKAHTVEKVMTIPLWIEQAVSAGFQKWHVIAGLLFALIVGLIMGLFLRTGKE